MAEFLGGTFLQMTPLLAIKYKMLRFEDRVAVLCRFGMKVLTMHGSLFLLNVAVYPVISFVGQSPYDALVNSGCFIVTLLTLHVGFNFSLLHLHKQEFRDVQLVWCMALALGCIINAMYAKKWTLVDFCVSQCNALELLTFMPALWMLWTMNQNVEMFAPLPENSSHKQATFFCIFVVTFYFHEDILGPLGDEDLFGHEMAKFAIMGHGFHFMVLLDFAIFFLFQAWSPKQIKNEDIQKPKLEESTDGLVSQELQAVTESTESSQA